MADLNSTASPKVTGDGSVRYFLAIENVDGGSSDAVFSHQFEVSATSFAASNPSGLKTSFSPLDLELKAGSATDELVQYLASGRHIARAQLVAVQDDAKGNPHVISDFRLADVLVTSLELNATGTSSVGLNYSAFQLTNETGPTETFGWNLSSMKELTAPIAPSTVLDESGTAGFKNIDWMLVLDGMDGGIKGKHAGAFDIDSFQFGMSLPVSTSAGGGSGSGKAQFNPLGVTMDFGSASDEILNYLATGKHMRNAQIIGVADTTFGKDQTVYDLRLSDVVFTGAALGAGASHDSEIKLDYAAFSLGTANSAGTIETTGFNRSTSSSSTTPLSEPTASAENGLNEGKTTWYMTIDGLNGGSTAKGHVGAFELSAWSFGGTNSNSISAGGGGGSGKVALSDFSAFFDPGSTMDDLLKLLATGKHLAHGLQIVGDTIVGGKTINKTFDLRFDDVTVAGLSDGATGASSAQFAFGAYTLSTKGTGGAIETTGWNVSTNSTLTSPLQAAVAPAGKFGDGPSKNTDFYLTISGLDGGADVKGHALAFKVDDFSLDATGGVRSSGGGGGSGKAVFSPLDLDLDLGGASADLLRYLATSKTFSARLVGDDPNRKGHSIVYDLRLGDVTIEDLTQAAKGSGHLLLDYGKFTLTTLNGANITTTSGFDTSIGQQITTPLAAASGADDKTADFGQMKYYLVINGMDGGVDTKGHQGAFLLNDFQFDMTHEANKKLGSLNATLDLGSAGDELLRAISTGVHIASARIVGDEVGKNGVANAFDLRIGDLTLSSLHLDNKGADKIGFSFRQGSIATKDEKGTIETQGYDFATQTILTKTIGAAKASDEAGITGSKMTYYLVIDGLNSGSTTKGHEGEFKLDSFNFNASLTSTISGGGGGSGKTTFSPLNVFFEHGAAADELLALVAKGLHIDGAQILAEAKIGKHVETVFDLRIDDLFLSSLTDKNQHEGLALSYQDVSLTTLNSKGEDETFAYMHGTTSTTPLPLPVVGEL